jgi:hypothetical protein
MSIRFADWRRDVEKGRDCGGTWGAALTEAYVPKPPPIDFTPDLYKRLSDRYRCGHFVETGAGACSFALWSMREGYSIWTCETSRPRWLRACSWVRVAAGEPRPEVAGARYSWKTDWCVSAADGGDSVSVGLDHANGRAIVVLDAHVWEPAEIASGEPHPEAPDYFLHQDGAPELTPAIRSLATLSRYKLFDALEVSPSPIVIRRASRFGAIPGYPARAAVVAAIERWFPRHRWYVEDDSVVMEVK